MLCHFSGRGSVFLSCIFKGMFACVAAGQADMRENKDTGPRTRRLLVAAAAVWWNFLILVTGVWVPPERPLRFTVFLGNLIPIISLYTYTVSKAMVLKCHVRIKESRKYSHLRSYNQTLDTKMSQNNKSILKNSCLLI